MAWGQWLLLWVGAPFLTGDGTHLIAHEKKDNFTAPGAVDSKPLGANEGKSEVLLVKKLGCSSHTLTASEVRGGR